MRLLNLSFFNKKTALVNLLVGRKMTLSLNRAQTLFNHADKVVMSDVSHGTDDVQNIARKIFSSNPTYTLVGDIEGYPPYDEIKQMIKL